MASLNQLDELDQNLIRLREAVIWASRPREPAGAPTVEVVPPIEPVRSIEPAWPNEPAGQTTQQPPEPKPMTFPSFDEPSKFPLVQPTRPINVEDLRRLAEPRPEPPPLVEKSMVDAFLTPSKIEWIRKRPAGWLVLRLLGRE